MSAQIVVVSVLTDPASTRIASAESALFSVTELLLMVALIRLLPSRAITSMPRLATWLMVLESTSAVMVALPLPVIRIPGPVVELLLVTVLPVTLPTIGLWSPPRPG